MSQPDKPKVGEVTAAAVENGPLEDMGGEDVAENIKEKVKPVEEDKEGSCEKKEEEVKMEDAIDKKGMDEEENKMGKKVKEVETVKEVKEKVEEEEKREHKDGESVVENDEEAMEKGEKVEENGNEGEEKTEEIEEKRARKKRAKALSNHQFGGNEEKIGKKKVGRKAKEVSSTPVASSIDRPARERKTVERLVEALLKEPSKALIIEKGQGTPLMDIPNVAYKLSKKKPADIRSLHLLLFGRKGKATSFKSHIYQFSGFVWHENEEKQRAKVKEKLDRCIKDKLLDFCDVFDIPVSRATSRKEDLVEKLLDFMVSPHATTDVILAEMEQSSKSRKRKRVSRGRASRTAGPPRKHLRKRIRGENTSEHSANETEDEDGDGDEGGDGEGENEDVSPDDDEAIKHSENEGNESEHDDLKEEYKHKSRQDPKKSKRRSSSAKASKKATTPEEMPHSAAAKSPAKTSSKHKADEDKNANEKVSLKKDAVTHRKKMSPPKPDMKEKKTIGKKAGRGKAKSDQATESGPTEEELRKMICIILKEVDFNTATFTDILKKLALHYNMDLMARKASIKLMIQDELTKLADEAEDEDDDNDDEPE